MLKKCDKKPIVESMKKSFFMRTAFCFIGCVLLLSSASPGCFVVGDLDGDCQVGIGDLVLIASQWMGTSSCGSEAGLVLHWKLDESSGTIAADSSGSGYNGTVVGASWNPMGGKLGGALQFDGINNYMGCSYQGITGSNPRTCAAWIKTDRSSGEIISWGDRDIDTGRWVVWVDGTGVLRVDVGGGYIFGTTVLTDDMWHHIAVTSDGSTTDNIALYVDGKTETISGIVSKPINTLAQATTKLGVFQLSDLTGSYFDGLIDDARIYNRVLSMQDVWDIATTATTNNSCADLNMDAIVNLSDIARLAQNWLQDAPQIIISEFLADNESKSPLGPGEILDGNGESSDWIEIHNNSGVVVDINGWYLTDDAALKTQWRFPTGKPQLQLQPGAYLIVFASGKTQAENPGNYPYWDGTYYHTNFQLSKDGEYLGLIDADGTTVIHEYNHINLGNEYGYPEQETDISYGYYYDEERYFSVPTPGADNNKGSFEEVTEKPDVNFKGGCYINAFNLTMSCTTPGAFIRYTTDGTVPSLINGLEYTAPVAVGSTTRIIVKAFKPGFQPSDARIETYIFLQSGVETFNSNLPIVVVDTLGAGLPYDEMVTNGAFGSDTVWTKGANWGITGGQAVYTEPASPVPGADILSQPLALVAGQVYGLKFTIVSLSAGGSIKVYLGGTEGILRTTTGVFTENIVAGSTDALLKIDGSCAASGNTIKIDDVSIEKANKIMANCIAVIVDTDPITGRSSITGPEHFDGIGQIGRRGESTYGQGNYAFEIQDEYSQDKDVSLLGMPAESDWVLSYDVIDYTMMKKEMAYKWFQDMGHYAPRQRYVELYLNTDGGAISTADYKGLFMLREKIKRDENRVDIARLDTSHNLEPKVSGGYIIKCDKLDPGDSLLADGYAPDYLEAGTYGINYKGGGKPIVAEPDSSIITSPQMNWIADYINEFHSVLWQNTASSYYPGPQAKYTDYIDVISWVDHGLLEQVCMDSDAFWGSYYTHKERDGKHYSGPPWDYDRGFHNNAGTYVIPPYNDTQNVHKWKTNGEIFGKWHQKLQENLEYKILLADRWFEHREKVLNTALTMAYIDQTKALISESRSRPKKTYPKPFDEEIGYFKAWITERLDYLDRCVAGEVSPSGLPAGGFAKRPPIFSPVGGYVNPGDSFGISKPSGALGDIYYTTNGQDPRVAGGGIDPNAAVYSGGSSVQTNETVVTMSSSVWKYLYDGSNQGTAWRAYGFNDGVWGSGPGQLGFGDNDETTNIGPKVNYRYTAYFRHKFNISNVSELTALKVTVIHDDGAVVYINDQEIGRPYMPTGMINFDTPANTQGENTSTVFSGISPSVLLEGNNILAVEVHQNAYNSSDLSFDL
ncbi:MAG: hypothetical protein FJ263_11360, partial [Planctomycetes bacterium]|nr:hypothetical protein [Planctomycetota bacterium]